jgi:UDP-N-acetylglucosamine--N-acetylmuramyl-(pentapeptide) pyrophosphoryl-undecaprenol N-acetylglucosamine transferase
MKAVITGGHHSSALPVIKIIEKEHPDTELVWIGHRFSQKRNRADTLEYLEITSLGIPFYDLNAGKFYKTYDPIRLLKIPLGFFQALFILLREKPDVILSFGGYIAVPVVIAGWVLRISCVTHEQTVVSGYANKLIAKFAKKVLVSWKQSADHFPPEKVVFTGLPLRESIFDYRAYNFKITNDLPTIYITAGKTGSHIINEWVKESLVNILRFCNIIHQCGDHSVYKDYEDLQREYHEIKPRPLGIYIVRKYIFENEIGEAFGDADLVVSRAGAHTIMELLALQKPCILIPIPWVSHNEQNENARILEQAGLAVVGNQEQLDPRKFADLVEKTLSKTDTLVLEDKSLLDIVKKNSAQIIVDEIFKAIKEKKKN